MRLQTNGFWLVIGIGAVAVFTQSMLYTQQVAPPLAIHPSYII